MIPSQRILTLPAMDSNASYAVRAYHFGSSGAQREGVVAALARRTSL